MSLYIRNNLFMMHQNRKLKEFTNCGTNLTFEAKFPTFAPSINTLRFEQAF